MTDPISLTLTPRAPLHVGHPTHVNLTLVGCGGTGSFLALHLARLAWHAREAQAIQINMTFVDPDRIEQKNIGRQNFVPAEVGHYKAGRLAARYGRAFGLTIRFFNEPLKPDHVSSANRYRDGWLHLMIGCVDNTEARRGIESIARGWNGRLWWLDCGNHDQAGQVILGNRGGLERPEIIPLGFCVGLPLPSVVHPELVETEEVTSTSCADATLADAQSLMVNQQVASWAASYLYRLLITHDLDTYATYFDLAAGSAKSEYIDGE